MTTASATVLINWGWIGRNLGPIGDSVVEHLVLTAPPVAFGFVLSFGLALLARRYRSLYQPLVRTTGVLFAVPSLAFVALLIPFLGLSRANAYVALTIYTLVVLLPNIVEGLDGVPADVTEAADAMGYSPSKRLLKVELPLATPVIIAGLRIATVTIIGLVTVTAFIGFGGLGDDILTGYNRAFPTQIVVGVTLTAALAILADVALLWLQRAVAPWRQGV